MSRPGRLCSIVSPISPPQDGKPMVTTVEGDRLVRTSVTSQRQSPVSERDGSPHRPTVLVTGSAGFVGNHLAAALADMASVRILDDFSTGVEGT